MSLKKANYFIGREIYKSAKIYTLIILLITAFFFAIGLIFSDDGSSTRVNGVDISMIIYCFIVGLTAYSSFIKMLFQNGISRKTIWLSLTVIFIMFALSFSIVFILLFEVLGVFFQSYTFTIFTSYSSDIVNYFYPSANYILSILLKIFVNFIILLFAGTIGIAMGTLFKILSKKWKIIVFAGIPALLVIIFPILFTILGLQVYSKMIMSMIGFLVGTPPSLVRISITLISISVISIALSRVLMSKVQIDD